MRNPFTFEIEPFRSMEQEQEWEAPSGGSKVALKCRPPIVLSGFKSEEYMLRFAHYTQLLALPLPAPVLVVRGHTDNHGSAVQNIGLSLSRVFEVVQWLTMKNGGNPIATTELIVEAFGAASPIASNGTEAGRAKNRRVEILWCEAPPPPPTVAGVRRLKLSRRMA